MYGQFVSTEKVSFLYPDNEMELRKKYKLLREQPLPKYSYYNTTMMNTIEEEDEEKEEREGIYSTAEIINNITEVIIVTSLLLYYVASWVLPS